MPSPEEAARQRIDAALTAAGWVVQDHAAANIAAARGVAVREFPLKGGHGTEDPVQDLCWERGENPRWHEHARIPGRGMHGSGCRYATAVAALLARGYPVHLAFREAGEWLARLPLFANWIERARLDPRAEVLAPVNDDEL